MALAPGETSESFIREVDENLRRSQAENFFRRWGGWLVGAALLVIAALGGFMYWKNHQAERAAEQSANLDQIFNDVGAGKTQTAAQRLAEIERTGPDQYAGLAKLSRAALALQNNDRKTAIAAYGEVAADGDQPEAVQQAALLRKTALEFDTLQPQDVVSRLQDLAKPGNPWFGVAGEMTAMAMLKQNRRAEAGRLFAAIAADKQAPQSLRTRAVQIAGTLGVDATAQLPASAQ